MKDNRIYLQHILDEIDYLESLQPNLSYEDLVQNKTIGHAVTRALEIIGEAAKNVPDPVKKANPKDSMEIHGRTSRQSYPRIFFN